MVIRMKSKRVKTIIFLKSTIKIIKKVYRRFFYKEIISVLYKDFASIAAWEKWSSAEPLGKACYTLECPVCSKNKK